MSELYIDGYHYENVNQQTVQSIILSSFTSTVKINGKNFDTLKLMSLDALCDLFKGAMELGGVNGKNMNIYDEIKNFQNKSYKFYDELKIADSICMDNDKSSFQYQTYNAKRNKIRKEIEEFRNKLITMAWNTKIRYA